MNTELKEEYWSFILRMKASKKFNVNPMTIHSIDVTYTKKPVKKVHTYSRIGSGKQKSVKKVKLYTDAIVTMISADGLNHTKCVLYTFNPRLSPVQKTPQEVEQSVKL